MTRRTQVPPRKSVAEHQPALWRALHLWPISPGILPFVISMRQDHGSAQAVPTQLQLQPRPPSGAGLFILETHGTIHGGVN